MFLVANTCYELPALPSSDPGPRLSLCFHVPHFVQFFIFFFLPVFRNQQIVLSSTLLDPCFQLQPHYSKDLSFISDFLFSPLSSLSCSMQCCESGMFIPDPNFAIPDPNFAIPDPESKRFRIPDPHHRIGGFKPQKTVSKLSEKWDVHPGSGSRFFSTVSHFLRLLRLFVSHCLVLHRHIYRMYLPASHCFVI